MIERIITGDLGVNTYIYNYKEKSAVVIDPGADSQKIISLITKLGYDIEGIILTHGHFDHIGAVKEIKEFYKTKVYIHEDDATFLGQNGGTRHQEMLTSAGPGGQAYFEIYYTENDAPDIVLHDKEMLDEFSLEIIHTPGHSPGSISLYSKKDSIIFSGDTLFKDGMGRTDFTGGDHPTLLKSLDKLSHFPGETKVYPGHGNTTTINRELGR